MMKEFGLRPEEVDQLPSVFVDEVKIMLRALRDKEEGDMRR